MQGTWQGGCVTSYIPKFGTVNGWDSFTSDPTDTYYLLPGLAEIRPWLIFAISSRFGGDKLQQ